MGIAAVGVGLAAVGTAVSVYGAVSQGQAQQRAADYQAQVAKNNATIAGQNATAVQNQAQAKAVQLQLQGDQRLGAQKAALLANGVTGDSVSALNVENATVENTAQSEDQATYQGQLAAYGYQSQGVNYNAQAQLDQLSGANAATAGGINAGSTALTGASQVSSKWAQYQLTGGAGSNATGLTFAQQTYGLG